MTEAQASATSLGTRIATRVAELAAISDDPNGLTRLYLSPAHRRAADHVIGWMREAGMTGHVDAVGNVIGRYPGMSASAPTLILGSHIDTVRNAGHYDGNLGVIAAIEVVADLARRGVRLPFAIDVAAFGDEEGVRFPSTLGGSRALAGNFTPSCLDEVDSDGITRRHALTAFGCNPDGIGALARAPASVLGYVELHIEQGPVLEAEALPVGIVTAINGATRGRIHIAGVSGHAGTVPMRLRHDAVAGAAEIILAIEALARAEAGLVATVGQITVTNGAVNTVAGDVELTIDVRSPDDRARTAAVQSITAAVANIATARGLQARLDLSYEASAAPCDAALIAAMSNAVASCGVTPRLLPSGAGHDGMAFRGVLPMAMLFVRCRGGISHNPAEYAAASDIDVATRAFAAFVNTLAPGVSSQT
jgi:allantoate deiminase